MRFTKAQLTRRALRRKTIAIPDTDGSVEIRELGADEVREHAARCRATGADGQAVLDGELFDRNRKLLAEVVMLGVVDEDGSPLFDRDNADDVAAVESMGLSTLNHLAEQISAFSGVPVGAERAESEKKTGDAG